MNTGVHVSFWISVFVFSRYIPRSGIARSYGSFIICKYFLPFSRLSFHFVNGYLCCAKAFKLNSVSFVYFYLYFLYFRRRIKKYCCDLFIYLFIYLWLCWVFVSVRGLSLVGASGGHSSSRCMGLSLSWPLLLQSTGSRCAGSVIVAHGPSCSVACGIFPDQGSNPCSLHWQADSQPLRHQGSPVAVIYVKEFSAYVFLEEFYGIQSYI